MGRGGAGAEALALPSPVASGQAGANCKDETAVWAGARDEGQITGLTGTTQVDSHPKCLHWGLTRE